MIRAPLGSCLCHFSATRQSPVWLSHNLLDPKPCQTLHETQIEVQAVCFATVDYVCNKWIWRPLRYVKSQRTHLENMFIHVYPNFQLTHSCYFCFSGALQHHLVDSGVSTALSELSCEENVTSISDKITRLISMLDSGWTCMEFVSY